MDNYQYPNLTSVNAMADQPGIGPVLQMAEVGELVLICVPGIDFASINATLFWLVFIVSIIGNGFLLYILFRCENLRNVTNLFILNLSFSDVVFTITLPFWATYHASHWIFGDFACKFLTAVYFVGLYSSVILLTAVTVDRFATVVVQNHLSISAKRWRCAVGACVAAWTVSLVASISDVLNTEAVDGGDGFFDCQSSSENKVGVYLQVSLLFFLPLAIIVFCYAAILRTVMHTSNRRKLRTIMVVLCIVAVFFLCWGPHHIMLLIETLYEPQSCEAQDSFYLVGDICRLLAYAHCCMNPLLYLLSQKLRRHLVRIFRCETFRRNSHRSSRQGTSNIFQKGEVGSNVLEIQSK